jgi:hypothetical protein
MFGTNGWKHIMDDFSDVHDSLDTLSGVDSEQQLFRNKGKLEVLNVLLSYEDTVRRILDEEAV